MMILTITFGNPWAWGLLIFPLIMLLFHLLYAQNKTSFTNFSHHIGINSRQVSIKILLRKAMPYFNMVAAVFLVVAIARPQGDFSKEKSFTNGIDIILAMDISTSMLERDFSPNRLEASKKVAAEFIEQRPNDRIGVVIFSGESFTQTPPTIDHSIVLKQLKTIQNGIIEDGTAIGMGLATSVRSLKNSTSKSKVVILLTDGVNTAGTIDPNTAIELAKALNVKVYCIGVGTPKGGILGIDEPLMQRIAKRTGGIYFRAGSNQKLKEIYNQINQLETKEIEVNAVHRKTEQFLPWAIAALILLIVGWATRYAISKSIN